MLFGVVLSNERRYLYRIEWLQTAKPRDRMSVRQESDTFEVSLFRSLVVTDFGDNHWTSGFTGKEILDSFDVRTTRRHI